MNTPQAVSAAPTDAEVAGHVIRALWIDTAAGESIPLGRVTAAMPPRARDKGAQSRLLAVRVGAAVNVYMQMFRPVDGKLESNTTALTSILRWRDADGSLHADVLWLAPWTVPLPRTVMEVTPAPASIRLLDLRFPFASRVYVDGRHTPAPVQAVA